MTTLDEGWRLTHLGRLLGHAMRRFDDRVLALMAHNIDVPLALSNLAARAQIGAAHIHITRHLELDGTRLTDLAQKAGMSKQAMGDLVDQCEAWNLVTRESDPRYAPPRRDPGDPGTAWSRQADHDRRRRHRVFGDAIGRARGRSFTCRACAEDDR